MKPPPHRRHPPAGQGSDEQLPGMALDGGNRKPRDLAVGDPRLHRHLVREPPEPGAQDDRDVGRGRESCPTSRSRSEEHTSELQSPCNLVCRLLLEKKKKAKKKKCDYRL